MEVAARRYGADALSGERSGAGGVSREVTLIDGATVTGSGSIPRDLVW